MSEHITVNARADHINIINDQFKNNTCFYKKNDKDSLSKVAIRISD